MNKRIVGVVLALMCSVVLISMFSSCGFATRSKALVIVNDSANAIDYVSITQYVSDSRAFLSPNALVDGKTIAAGPNKTFYIAPYATYHISLLIRDDGIVVNYENKSFTYDYRVRNRNRAITAVYGGTSITMTGSNVVVEDDD